MTEFTSDEPGCLAEEILTQHSSQAVPGLPINCTKTGVEAPSKNRMQNFKGNKAKGCERFAGHPQKSKEKSCRGASSNLAKEISLDKMKPDASGQ